MTEMLTAIFKILLLLLGWGLGKASEKKARAKEIATQFSKLSRDGDVLGKQVWEELNQRSDRNWEDIPVRRN